MPRSRLGLTRGGCRKPCGCFRKPVGAPPSCFDQGGCGNPHGRFRNSADLGRLLKNRRQFPQARRCSTALPKSRLKFACLGGGRRKTPRLFPQTCRHSTKLPRGRLWLTWGGGGKPCDCFRKPVGALPNCRDQSWPVEAANNPTAISASPSALHQAA